MVLLVSLTVASATWWLATAVSIFGSGTVLKPPPEVADLEEAEDDQDRHDDPQEGSAERPSKVHSSCSTLLSGR